MCRLSCRWARYACLPLFDTTTERTTALSSSPLGWQSEITSEMRAIRSESRVKHRPNPARVPPAPHRANIRPESCRVGSDHNCVNTGLPLVRAEHQIEPGFQV